MSKLKQAVVVIHGMGEQRPMETISSFVDTVWTQDANLSSGNPFDPNTGKKRPKGHNFHWIKPDPKAGSHEMRRLTTEQDKNGRRTDFFEFYWAHLTHDNAWTHVRGWLLGLLFRPLRRVPKDVRTAWFLIWALTLLAFLISLWGLYGQVTGCRPWPVNLFFTAVGPLWGIFSSEVLIKRFGDVARFVDKGPQNIAAREAIREKGVKLLSGLIDSGRYDRIILVSHSQGTIVGYDILSTLFALYNKKIPPNPGSKSINQSARMALEAAIADAYREGNPLNIDTFQALQHAALQEARDQGSPWIITDFITLGSPLTHAEFLMARDEDDLRAQQGTRLLPTCPPQLEYSRKLKNAGHEPFGFTYDPLGRKNPVPADPRPPPQGAVFADPRRTNLYSPSWRLAWGDLISGPLGQTFGLQGKTGAGPLISGIRDVPVLPTLSSDLKEPAPGHRRVGFSHTHYWNLTKGSEVKTDGPSEPDAVPDHIAELRKALDLA